MDDQSLQDATTSGVRWLLVMRIVSESIGLASVVVLARLITPAAFGHAAIALIFILVGVILTFEGFASALVQRPVITEADKQAGMLMSLIGGLALSGLVYGLAGPLWSPLFGSTTASLIKLVSPVLFIASCGSVSRSLVWRSLDFRTVSSVDAISLLAGSIASVVLAILGVKSRAIVLGGMVQITTSTLLLLLVCPPPVPRFSRHSQREITRFGIPSALAGLLAVIFQNIDYAILAVRLPAATVGLYYRAFNVSVVYQDKVSKIMTQLAFPIYARTSSREALRAFHERVARVHALLIFPMLATSAALAPILVPLVFGGQWRGAVPATEILTIAGCVSAVLTGYPQLLLAIGKPQALMMFNAAIVVVYGGAVYLASTHGFYVIAFTVSGVYVVILLGVYHLLLRRYLGLSIGRLAPELGPAAVGSLALASTDIGIRLGLSTLPGALVALLAIPAGVIVYGLVVSLVFPRAWNDLIAMVIRVAPRTQQRLARLRRRDGRGATTSGSTTTAGQPAAAAVEATPVPVGSVR
jgi:O-antigen/teichoic acid export membrane protein